MFVLVVCVCLGCLCVFEFVIRPGLFGIVTWPGPFLFYNPNPYIPCFLPFAFLVFPRGRMTCGCLYVGVYVCVGMYACVCASGFECVCVFVLE